MRTRRSRLTAFLAVAVGMFVALPAAEAQAPDPAGLRLDARLGIGGFFRTGRPAPLVIVVESPSRFAGSVEVVVGSGFANAVLRRPLEVPAGGRAAVRLVAPAASIVEVRAADRGGRVLARVTPTGADDVSVRELVGVVASEKPVAARIDVSGVDRVGRVVEVSAADLDLGSVSLGPLSHLVVDASIVSRLSEGQRDAILGFAADGGELIVVSATDAGLAFLPQRWRATGGGAFRRVNDDARVTILIDEVSPARWAESDARWARSVRAAPQADQAAGELTSGEWPAAITEGRGFRRPSISWLLAFLLAYVLLAGPVNFFVLARARRRELAWLTVPALAIVFAAGAYTVGRGVRNVPIVQGNGIAVLDAGVERSWVGLGLLSRSGGVERFEVGKDWLAVPLSPDVGRAVGVLRLGHTGSVAEFRLPVGAIGGVVARRLHLREGQTAGELVIADGTAKGTVINTSGLHLRRASVVLGRSAMGTFELAPGQRSSVTLEGLGPAVDGFDPGFLPDFDGQTYTLMQRAGRIAGLGEPGRAFLVGRVSMQTAGPRLGLGAHPGEMLVMLPLRVRTAGATPPGGWRRMVISADGAMHGEQPHFIDQARDVTVRFEAPGGTRPKKLSISVFNAAFGPGERPVDAPLPVPPQPPQLCKMNPDGSLTCAVQPQPQVDPAGGSVFVPGGSGKVQLYDWASGKWRDAPLKDNAVTVASSARGVRYLSDGGDVLVRMLSEFATPFQLGSVVLEGLA